VLCLSQAAHAAGGTARALATVHANQAGMVGGRWSV
jgi:hypothetical protein